LRSHFELFWSFGAFGGLKSDIILLLCDPRVSTTPENPGNLLEFKNPPGNPGNLLEFNDPPGNFCVR